MQILDLRSLSVSYRAVTAVSDLSLQVGNGELVVLLGSNGAGKTSTLAAVSGFVRPRGGEMSYQGEDLGRLNPVQRVAAGIVHVPEGRRVFGGMSVTENLQLGGYTCRNRVELSRRINTIFGLIPRLAERRHQLAGTLSGGEQQMLAIGRGLVAAPRLLLLDEPTMGLAPKATAEVLRLIRTINREGVSVLLVEQNARMALRLASRGYVLEGGRCTVNGTAEELLDSPHVAAAYLGTAPGNLAEAR